MARVAGLSRWAVLGSNRDDSEPSVAGAALSI
jgi:hypothetical protein